MSTPKPLPAATGWGAAVGVGDSPQGRKSANLALTREPPGTCHYCSCFGASQGAPRAGARPMETTCPQQSHVRDSHSLISLSMLRWFPQTSGAACARPQRWALGRAGVCPCVCTPTHSSPPSFCHCPPESPTVPAADLPHSGPALGTKGHAEASRKGVSA